MADWKKIILTIAIAIIFVFFIGFGIDAFYDSPEYEDFCGERIRPRNTKESCEANDGEWIEDEIKPVADQFLCTKGSENEDGEIILICNTRIDDREYGYCDINRKCEDEFDKARDVYNKNVFIICAVIGLITIAVAGIYLKKESVGAGTLAGGVLTVIYGTIRYWEGLGQIMRFMLLGLILALLIWIGYKKIKD